MKIINTVLITIACLTLSYAQPCVTFDSFSLVSNNGNGTCTYDVSLIVDSGNGASGTATFSIGGSPVYAESNCICNPTTIVFPVTVNCGSTIVIDVFYDAPGNGNDCTGSTGDIILPVKLVDLNIENKGDTNVLTWSTLEEIDNDRFVIEHSISGSRYIRIGEIKGVGSSQRRIDYVFNHKEPVVGLNYYRLKQIDYNGDFTYSKVINTYNKSTGRLNAYPNPFINTINIKSDEDQPWQLLDSNGNIVLKGNSREINTSKLPSGNYFLLTQSGSIDYLLKMVKQ